MPTIIGLLERLQASPLAVFIHKTAWAFTTLQVVHVFAISLVIATIAMVDLRLLGFASTKRPFAELSRRVLPFTWAAFALAVVAGGLLFISRATEYVGNTMFWIKMFLIVLAGINMLVFYHEASKVLGMEKPSPIMPFQLAGLVIGLFGVGYWLVQCRPLENRDLLWLGFWSKLLGPLLSIYHVLRGDLPWVFLPLVVVSDLVYLPLFYLIGKRLGRYSK